MIACCFMGNLFFQAASARHVTIYQCTLQTVFGLYVGVVQRSRNRSVEVYICRAVLLLWRVAICEECQNARYFEEGYRFRARAAGVKSVSCGKTERNVCDVERHLTCR